MKQHLNDIIEQQIKKHQLPSSYQRMIDAYLMPLGRIIDRRIGERSDHKPLVLGVCGGQGTGKSTLCHFLQLIFKEVYDYSSVVLSIDDFYLSRAERSELAANQHPLLQTRGVPGTHDVALALTTLNGLLAGESVALPQFNKATDDVLPVEQWLIQKAPVDIIMLEGWFVGASPQPDELLKFPVNKLERDEDVDGSWRRFANQRLAKDYQQLFGLIDYLLMLKAPDMAAVLEWRSLQEKKLAAQAGGCADAVMDNEQILRFIQHFERLTRHMMIEMPSRADAVFTLLPDHSVAFASGLGSRSVQGS